ncbi:Glutamate receptor, ionotropic kainate, partial [Ooceraea biroi]
WYVTVCHLLRGGVAAIFGPQNAQTASHVQSICDTMEIPHLETRWDWRQRRQSCLVNLYPHPTTLSKVFLFVKHTWTRIAVPISSLRSFPSYTGCIYAHHLLCLQYGRFELNAKELKLSKFLLINRKFRGKVQLKASLANFV